MSQLTAEERRRTREYRQAAALGGRRPRSMTIEEFAGRQRAWSRSAAVGALLALAVAVALVVAQAAPVSVHSAPALIEWLMPRV